MPPGFLPIRRPGTARDGRNFSDADKLAVWQKAAQAPNLDTANFRLDSCGAVIAWDKYGDTIHHSNGWEIDHIYPVARGGTDASDNLQALQWQNNREKSDKVTVNYCLVSRSS